MKTVYILTEGAYSSYRIVGAFSTLELAKEAQLLCPDSGIEEYDLDSQIPDYPKGHTAWWVTIQKEGGKIEYSSQTEGLVYFRPGQEEFDTLFTVSCWARDREHAEKIALDQYYQWKYETVQKSQEDG